MYCCMTNLKAQPLLPAFGKRATKKRMRKLSVMHRNMKQETGKGL